MKKILDFRQFIGNKLNEDDSLAGLESTAGKGNAIAFLSAYASKTPISPSFATELGIKQGIKYQFEIDLSKIYALKEKTKLSSVVKLGKGEQFSGDYLEINGKSIKDKGSLVLTSMEIKKGVPLKISAAGNGILILFRMADCLNDMGNNLKIGIGNLKSYAMKFQLGNDKVKADARGYTYWAANPLTNLKSLSNTISNIIAEAALKAVDEKRIVKEGETGSVLNYQNHVKGKKTEEIVNRAAQILSKILIKKGILANKNPGPVKDADEIENKKSSLFREDRKGFLVYTDTGISVIRSVMNNIIDEAIKMDQSHGFGPECEPIFKDYISVIKGALSQVEHKTWLQDPQEKHGEGEATYGQEPKGFSGKSGDKQKEGDHGTK
jgi:hypothetical protein